MRTKALLCAAALVAAGATAMAQSNVYSLNVVGYVNLTLNAGEFTAVANQMDADGTGTNNSIATVFGTNLPAPSAVYKWNAAQGTFNVFQYTKSGRATAATWTPTSAISFNPGEMALVQIPAGSPVTLTTLGNVLQGSLVNPNIPVGGGFCGVSMMYPVGGQIQSALNYTPQINEAVYKWNSAQGTFNVFQYSKSGRSTAATWLPSQPTINVGEGFLLQSVAGSTWSNNFTVPQ